MIVQSNSRKISLCVFWCKNVSEAEWERERAEQAKRSATEKDISAGAKALPTL